ncbi:endo-1,4-beta-xylanase [Cellulomonas flavigena]|uniref:endo-1,4-beta-xylanase n=1 Tax=Cellulomonas flavigena TaxID=1711 RepID=UPI0002F2885C|nr:endo-1,4-beta-xylanase [Cellulomonas flavigena]
MARHRRRTGALALATVLAIGVPAAPGWSAVAGLDDAARLTGRSFGTALQSARLGDPTYVGLVEREFGSVTPENELTLDALQPVRGRFTFDAGDRAVDWARARGTQVRGRTLLWHAGQPGWLAGLAGSALREAMLEHVTRVVEHYRGEVHSWDVVSEAFVDGTGARRASNFQRTGDDWIEAAFRAARAADPGARLCYNDYHTDDLRHAKTQAVLAMVADLRARGVPIDCVGLESHFGPHTPVPEDYRATLEAFTALGVEVQITELDVEGSGDVQAADYARVVSACLAVQRCTGITVWGVRDVDSWRPGGTPLLFDRAGAPKPAYHAVLAVLTAGVPPDPTPAPCPGPGPSRGSRGTGARPR